MCSVTDWSSIRCLRLSCIELSVCVDGYQLDKTDAAHSKRRLSQQVTKSYHSCAAAASGRPVSIGIGDARGRGGCAPPPKKKNSGKYFSGNCHVKFGHFLGKNHTKLGSCNFHHTVAPSLYFLWDVSYRNSDNPPAGHQTRVGWGKQPIF